MAVVVIEKATGAMKLWWDNAAESARGFDSTPYATDVYPDYDVVVVDDTMEELNEKIRKGGEAKLAQRQSERPDLEVRGDEEAVDILTRLDCVEQKLGEPGATPFMDVEGNLTDVWLPLPPKKEGIELMKDLFAEKAKGKAPTDTITVQELAEIFNAATE